MKSNGMKALAVACIFSLTVAAQQPTTPSDGSKPGARKEFKHEMKERLTAKKRAGFMAVEMELTDAQRDKLQALFEKQDKQRDEHMAEVKKLREQEMAKAETIRKANDAELEKILGTEKFQQFKAKQAERREKFNKMRQRRFGNKDGMRFNGDHSPRPMNNEAAPQLQK